VSHTHIDHFIGFDRLIRLFLSRDARLALWGPPGIIRNVAGKLAGYTWNLVDGYPFVLEVHEVDTERMTHVRLRAETGFALEEVGTTAWDGVLYEDAKISVHAAILNHRIPCLGFAAQEKSHLNVRTDELEHLGIPAGRWLNDVKDAIRQQNSDDTTIVARWRDGGSIQERSLRLGDLRDHLVIETPGQRLAYVVDTLFSRDNAEKIERLARNADVFYCESLFLDLDRDQATKRHHLTARQAGTLARRAGAKRLEVFHFSPRYDGQPERLYAEAAGTFRGELELDEPLP
jgi:ribonuclease Z